MTDKHQGDRQQPSRPSEQRQPPRDQGQGGRKDVPFDRPGRGGERGQTLPQRPPSEKK
jgi:hypothetical protein